MNESMIRNMTRDDIGGNLDRLGPKALYACLIRMIDLYDKQESEISETEELEREISSLESDLDATQSDLDDCESSLELLIDAAKEAVSTGATDELEVVLKSIE